MIRSLVLLALCAAPIFANANGPDLGLTGAPGESNCTACHSGTPLNQGGGSFKIELLNATTYTPGQQHRLRITLADPAARRWGFQLTARRAANNQRAGTLASENVQVVRIDTEPTAQYASQVSGGTRTGQANESTWEVLWTAPAAGQGPVIFYAAGNAANSNLNSFGDNIYTTSLEVAESGAAPELKSRLLPQFVYGPQAGGNRWTTLLYFHNSTPGTLPMELVFRDDTGQDISTFPGGARQSRNLAAGETVRIETPDAASFVSGWVEARLPTGVSGYAVFRQSFPGRDDNEAVVLLSEDSKSAWTLIHDDAGLITGLSLLNPGSAAVTVNYTARNLAGQTVGSGTLNLGPRSKSVGLLTALPGLAALTGQRGAVEFRVASGALAVLGLRFGASAFTSVPALER